MKSIFFVAYFLTSVVVTTAQLKIDNATFFIQPGATVTVQGDVTSNVDIQGTGLLLLKGSTLQHVDMGGFSIPNLELDNAANATLLNTNARIGNSFLFTNGKFQTGNSNLSLAPMAAITGNNVNRFFWTNGTGELRKELTANVTGYELPVGENNNYRPAYLTTIGSSFAAANFGVRVIGTAAANKPPSTAAHLNTAWPVSRTGIAGGTVTLEAEYVDPVDVAGVKANIFGYYNNGTDWTSAGATHTLASNRVSAPITTATGTVSGINKFLAVGSRAFLQGAYDFTAANSGLMFDNLRTLPMGSSASTANFPSTDPYRVAPYSTNFTHVNNSVLETIPMSSILASQPIAANNIVDWVFLELRNLNPSPGNTILQTRSALIQRDGDIVDVDGVSPVTFNNLANGNYMMSVRHRNHLGLSIDQTNPRGLDETSSSAFGASKVFDFRTAGDTQLFGNAGAFASVAHPTLGTVSMLWGGNANANANTRYSGLNNDRDALLVTALGNNSAAVRSNVYHIADLNMNRIVRYSGLGNDRDFLLIRVLNNNSAAFKIQSLPN
jgi:hypothetical protein